MQDVFILNIPDTDIVISISTQSRITSQVICIQVVLISQVISENYFKLF